MPNDSPQCGGLPWFCTSGADAGVKIWATVRCAPLSLPAHGVLCLKRTLGGLGAWYFPRHNPVSDSANPHYVRSATTVISGIIVASTALDLDSEKYLEYHPVGRLRQSILVCPYRKMTAPHPGD